MRLEISDRKLKEGKNPRPLIYGAVWRIYSILSNCLVSIKVALIKLQGCFFFTVFLGT